jgi:ribosomal protein S18 acetylase RimI-like enzyme
MEQSKITIRVAGKEDAPLIADLSRRTFYDTFSPYNTRENMDQFMEVQFTREQLMEEIGAPRNTFLLAYLDETPAGYARLYDGSELPRELAGASAIEISRIYCDKPAIGKGVGKALMNTCLETGRQKGKEWIWLCVWEHNQRAIDFYTKTGFTKFGQHIFILGQDLQNDWSMKKKL